MNEYLYEIGVGDICKSYLSDEEIMIEVCRKTLHANKKKRLQKEKCIYGKSITHQGCIF